MNVDHNFSLPETVSGDTKWINPKSNPNLSLYGFNWFQEDQLYRRLPMSSFQELETITPAVNRLADNTSGGQIHFRSDSSKLILKVKLTHPVSLANMTAVSQGGFDCYVGKDYHDLKFYNTTRFELNKTEYVFTLFENENTKNLIVLNFPLYGGVSEVLIGLDVNASLMKPEPLERNGKIVIYGTSITQGGCASRPGLSFTNILSRRLQCEFINLGFSGNAFGEIEVARVISQIHDAKLFIIDYEANSGTNGKMELTLDRFIRCLRENNPETPIAVLSRIKYLFDDLKPTLGTRREALRKFQENMVKKFRKSGDKFVYYIDGSRLMGKDYHEYTIDSIHPNDLGFMKIADGLEKRIRKILNI